MLDQETNMKQFNYTFTEDNSSASDVEFTQPESQSPSSNKEPQYNSGRWTTDEHLKFIDGFLEHGNEWKKVQSLIGTRSSTQARSHAQKFFLRIKKNFSVLDGICSTFPATQESLNDSVSIKNFLELLTSQEKEKMKLPSEQLSENQKLKLLHLVAKLSNTPPSAFGNGKSSQQQPITLKQQGQGQLQPVTKTQKDGMNHEGKAMNIEEYDEDEEMISATITHLSNKKIFNIKKDRSRRESINSLNYGKSTLRCHRMSVDEQSFQKENSLNIITSSDLCSTNSISPLNDRFKVKNYDEMTTFFGKKRKSDSRVDYEDFTRPRFNSTIEGRSDDIFSIQMNENDFSTKSNAFVINFDEFSINNEQDQMKLLQNGTNENEAMKIDYDQFISLNH